MSQADYSGKPIGVIKRRIAILGTRGIPARYGGFETFAEQLAARLVSAGVDVTVYCEHSSTDQPVAEYRGIKLVYKRAPRLGPLSTIVFDFVCLWHSRRNFDVVYMLGYGASLFCFIPRLWGSAVWINMDGIEWARSKWSWIAKSWFMAMEALAMRTASLVIADAEAIRAHLERRHSGTARMAVISYGADMVSAPPDTSLLAAWQLSPAGYYLVVCRLEPENQVREIIEGFSRTTSQHPLIIVGDHTSGTSYVNDLLETGDNRIRFIGAVYDKQLLQALRWHCRAYCHGHSVGGTNPSLLEALGCGNRVLAHDNLFNREVAQGCARYFASADNFRQIVEAVDGVATSESDRKAAQRRVLDHYDWDTIAESYLVQLNNN